MNQNQIIRVTKEFRLEMAHALWNYDGPCKTIHGHSYILYVTVKGCPITDENNTKLGMVIDFGQLKTIVYQEIISKFDHALVVSNKAILDPIYKVTQMFDQLYIVDYQPTCENLVIDFAQKIASRLPENVVLHNVKLYETATSYAEWYFDDNY